MILIEQRNTKDLTNQIFDKLNNTQNNIVTKLDITHSKFADGEIGVLLNESVRNQTVLIVATPSMPYDNLFELLITVDACRRSSAKEIIALITYLPHSRQEQRNDKRTSITARLVADMLQNAGVDRIISMDLHTNAIEGFYSIPFDNVSASDLIRFNIQYGQYKNPILVSPDYGGIKRVKKIADKLNLPMAFLNKERLKPNQIASMDLIGDVKGFDCIIVDDMIDSGGTLIKASDLLMNSGANLVDVYVTHGLFSGDAINNLIKSKINKVFYTNTINNNIEDKKFHLLDVSDIFVNAIEKLIY